MKGKKKIIIPIIVMAIVGIVCLIGGTYALFYYNKKGTIENEITTGKITFRYDEDSVNGINLQKAMPIPDYQGTELTGEGQVFDFTISTEGTDSILGYNIELEVAEDSTLDPSLVKVYLTNVVDGVETSTCIHSDNMVSTVKNNNSVLGMGYFYESSEVQERHYRLRIWIDKDTDFSPLKNEDGTYQMDSEGNYIYPYNNQTFKARINVSATAGFMGDTYCSVGPWDKVASCDEGECYIGSTFTLNDNSTWKIIGMDYSQNTVTLIYDHYIDAQGNYNVDETYTYSCTSGGGCDSSTIDVDTALNNFASKLKIALQDENITASLPSAEMIGVTLRENYFEAYILSTQDWKWNYNNPYILSDYKVSAICSSGECEKDYFIVGHNKVSSMQYQITGNNVGLKVGIKPIITISKDYLSQ